MKKVLLGVLLLFSVVANADDVQVYPTHWWAGMKDTKLQLIIHADKDIAVDKLVFQSSSKDVKVVRVNKVENKHYLIVDLEIAKNAKPQKLSFSFGGILRSEWTSVDYELKARSRDNGKTRVQGVNAADFIYLLMPDRFANGDQSNDIIPGYRDNQCDRSDKFSRHGGDFRGIENHLDYFNQLGVTTLWLTPVIENDMPRMTEWGNKVAGYHGYWFTDHYSIDKRFGGNEGYKAFCNKLHERGMKVIQDAVYNHVGNHHWFVLDSPSKDWFNTSQGDKAPSHREEVFYDPYVSQQDKRQMLDGWFVPHLPDLNQRNPYVANFLIQHAVWTTEEFGIDGWRVDTYKYCEEKFMNDVNTALEREFPSITVFGESWVNTTIANAYFTRNNINAPFKHNARGMLDFQVCFAMLAGMNEKFGLLTGLGKIYNTLAGDLLYQDPMNNCIFLDNHDMDRVFSEVEEDWNKLKMGINWLLTLRGIPQIYYGTEVLMKNKKVKTDATVREDFPGGWASDKPSENRFTKAGRTDTQHAAFEYISALAGFRKSSSALTTGKTMQYVPKDSLYVYFRYDAKQTIMVVTNTGAKDTIPDWKVFTERLNGFTRAKDVVSGNIKSLSGLAAGSKNSVVYELLR
ncbi:MAG: alpha-amylase family glycosyl hydrolase [Bacteroidetes bacterium]|nr:alpha-amylase family glycosyl hydrolase [Bacteroidota bacterium]